MSVTVDLHVHTSVTSACGSVKPKDVVALYTKASYDAIVITDHFYKDYFEELGALSWEAKTDCFLQGYREAKAASEAAGAKLKVFLGMEYRNQETDDDFLVIGLEEEWFYTHREPYRLPLAKAIALFHEAGAFVIQAHPVRMRLATLENGQIRRNYRTHEMNAFLKHHPDTKRIPFVAGSREIQKGNREAFVEPVFMRVCDLRMPKLLDGIETYNGNYNWMQDETEIADIMRKYPHLTGVSSSDFHESGHCARGGTVFDGRIATSADLVKALKEKRIVRLIETKEE